MRNFSATLLLFVLLLCLSAGVALSADDAVSSDSASDSGTESAPSEAGAGTADDAVSEALYEMRISLGLGAEYNDNIDDRAHNRRTDIISHVKPSFYFSRTGGRLQADIKYRGDYRYYGKGKDTEEYRHNIDATLTGELIENLFYLTVNENMKQVYSSMSRGEFVDDDSSSDTVNRNSFSVSPSIRLMPSDRTSLNFSYNFTDLRYSKDVTGSSNPDFLSFDNEQFDFSYKRSQSHTVSANLSHELSDRAKFFAGTSITRWEDLDKDRKGDSLSFYRYLAYLGGEYEFSEDLSARLRIGPSYSKPDHNDASLRPFIETDITYTLGRSTFGMSYNTSYEDNPSTGGSTRHSAYTAWWNKEFDRAKLTAKVSYDSYSSEVSEDDNETNAGNSIKPNLRLSYDLSDRLSCFADYTAQLYESASDGSDRYYGRHGLRYQLDEASSIALSHMIKYTDAQRGDSYYVNKVMLELAHQF